MLVYISYATPDAQTVIEVKQKAPVTAKQAILNSGILEKHPDVGAENLVIGIYGKKCPLKTELREFDRVEIYRPLLLTPVEARRLRAANVKKQPVKTSPT